MTTRRSSILAFAVTLFAAGTPLAAQQVSTGAHYDSTARRPGWQARDSRYPRVVLALTAGSGAMQFDCSNCAEWKGSSAPVFEGTAGLSLSRSIHLLVSAGAAFTTGRIDTSVSWKTLALRVHARPLGGLYFQPGIGIVNGEMTRDVAPPCDDWCQMGAILTLGLSLIDRTRTETLATVANGLVLPLSVGYDLHLRGGISITPQLRVMLGKAGVNGLSVGLQKAIGGSGPVWR